MSNAKRPRIVATLEDKFKALNDLEQGESRMDVMKKYGVKKSTLGDWIKNKEDILRRFKSNSKNTKKKIEKACKWPNVDEALCKWFKQARTDNVLLADLFCYIRHRSLLQSCMVKNVLFLLAGSIGGKAGMRWYLKQFPENVELYHQS